MAKRYMGLKAFGSKAVSVAASAALALSLTPAIALADAGAGSASGLQAQAANLTAQHYEPNNTTGLHVVSMNEDGAEAALVSSSANKYVYKGYAHGDQSHYGSYSLYTELTTDANGTLTGINLTSDVDTFYSKWGKYMQKNTSYYGYLPDGVSLVFDKEGNVARDDEAGTTTATVQLSGAKGYGVAGVTAKFYKGAGAQSIGDAVTDGVSFDEGDLSGNPITSKATFNTADGVNLIEITYQIGYDKTKFIAYICLDEDAEAQADAAEANMIDFKAEKGQPTSGTGLTDRDRWTYYMLSQVAQRELRGYAAYLKNKDDAAALGGVDVVSGATKTSEPFKAALEDAVSKGYVKDIAEDVSLTLDGGAADEVDVAKKYSDQTTVAKNADGSYALDIAVPTNASYDGSDSHTPYIEYVMTYDLGSATLTSDQMLELAQSASFKERTAIADSMFAAGFKPTHIYGGGYANATDSSITDTAIQNTPFEDSSSGVKWELGNYASGKTKNERTGVETEYLKVDDYKMAVPAGTTHVMVAVHIGHAYGYVAYDLESMTKVTPVVDEIAQLNDTSSETAVASARSAYEALRYDVQGFVTNLGILKAQEKRISEAKAAAETSATAQAAATANAVSAGDVKTVSSQTYKVTKVATAKAQGAVTFTKAKNAKSVTVPATVTLDDGLKYKVTQVAAGAFTASKIRSVTIGSNVTKIAAKAFSKSKATKAIVKTTSLKKANVKNCFKGSTAMKTVKVPKKKLTAYKKIFTKKITGSSKALKVTK